MGNARNILLVEEPGNNAIATAQNIRKFGYEVTIASSGAEAVEHALNTSKIELVLMDIDLNHGMDAAQAAREILQSRSLPIVFLTAQAELEAVERVKEVARYGYVCKNSAAPALASTLEMALALFEARQKERESENQLKEAQKIAKIGRWVLGLSDNRLEWSGSIFEIFEIDPSVFKATYEAFLEAVHPEDREMVNRAYTQSLADRTPYEIEHRLLFKDGRIKWVREICRTDYDLSGQALRSVGVVQEITGQKRAEEALERRIIALTQPLDQASNITIEELFNLEEIQRLQDQFSNATGVASIITRPDGTPITEQSNFCRLCKDIIRKTPRGLANCFRSDAALGRLSVDGPSMQPCMSGGLWDAGARISVGGFHVANWLIGQVRDETQTDQQMRAYAREIGADEETLLAAFREVPAMSREQFQKVAQVLFTLANQLSASAYQNVQQARFITGQNQTEKALRKSEHKFRSFVQQNSEGFLLIDEQGIIIEWNQALARIMEIPTEAAVGHFAWEIQNQVLPSADRTPERFEKLKNSIMRITQTGRVPSYGLPLTVRLNRPNGAEFFIQQTLFTIKTDSGHQIGSVIRDITEEKRFEQEIRALNLELLNAYDATIEGWASTLELRSQETVGHSRRVVDLTLALSYALNISEAEQENIRRGAILHDIGKIGIPDTILLKPGPLTNQEWEQMRQHPTYAYRLLSRIPFLQTALDIPYCHHEQWNGGGYPRGLKGEAIPLSARIFTIVDVWDALTSNRPYRPAWMPADALQYIQSQSGIQFDPQIVAVFVRLVEDKWSAG